LNVLTKGRHIDDTFTEFFDSFPSPPSSEPVGIFQPNELEITVAEDESQVLTGSAISSLLSGSTIGKRDRAQKTALENDIGKTEGSISTRTSIHNMGMHIHSLNSRELILLSAPNSLQELLSSSSTSGTNGSASFKSLDMLLSILQGVQLFNTEVIRAAASDTIMVCIRSKAGCLRELWSEESFRDDTREGPLSNKIAEK